MQLEDSIRKAAAKEITLFFSSPIGYLFLGVFAAVTLFVFFWGEAFFSRNIADVRPLFEWMPILLIFLSAALTMRMWSEERRTGTLEFILTLPAPAWHFIAGKFLACLILLAAALAITLPLPISVELIADLDWGPIISAYFATFLLGAAYLSIGLYVSARSDNQIVSLLLTTIIGGALYLLGSPMLTDFFGNVVGEQLRNLGTGSRFNSITRGVLDFRDLYYYVSIIGVFLALNLYALEKQRWDITQRRPQHSLWRWATGLLVVNVLTANVWLSFVGNLRVDTTRGDIYSISNATYQYIDQIREPLTIRGYFSAKTHPLLAPLVPELKDLLQEYKVAGGGKINIEFIDPASEPELEEEANRKYGIKPVPFQVADRYQASVVNSYFNVLIQYGDEYEVLGFQDLIEVKPQNGGELEVLLRNPEYDITRSLKKVLYSFQAGGNILAQLKKPVTFTGYISADQQLPQPLQEFQKVVRETVAELAEKSAGKLQSAFIDPNAGNGEVAQQINQEYGFRPMSAGLFSDNAFYFYLTLSDGDNLVQLPLPEELDKESLERYIDSGLKRFASGFLKTVGLVAPEVNYQMAQQGMGGNQYTLLREILSQNMTVDTVSLSEGNVPHDVDILVVLDPVNFNDKQVFAIDQFLMKGGTVVLAASPFNVTLGRERLSATPQATGLENWLSHYGLEIGKEFVMDEQNSAFPVPVTRRSGMFSFQEIRRLDYPYFVDVRGDGINEDNMIVADIPEISMAWSSPISVDTDKNAGRDVIQLLQSSANSWVSDDTAIMPNVNGDQAGGFQRQNGDGHYSLGSVVTGSFSSYFSGKDSPLRVEDSAQENAAGEENAAANGEQADEAAPIQSGILDKSSDTARIVLFSSTKFLDDTTLKMASSLGDESVKNALQMLANAVEWSLEDRGLLSIRGRSHFNRTLPPMSEQTQLMLEYGNYVAVIIAIVLVAWLQGLWRRRNAKVYVDLLGMGGQTA